MRSRIPKVILITLILLLISTSVYASTERAAVEGGMKVTLNGNNLLLTDANDYRVYPILFNGTTYLPVRAISESLGLKVDWEQSTRTVILEETDEEIVVNTANTTGNRIYNHVKIEKGISVKLDGKVLDLRSSDGSKVYPMMLEGSTYLPVRALAETLNMKVNWNAKDFTVEITTDKEVLVNREGSIKVIKTKSNIPVTAKRLDKSNSHLFRINGDNKDMRYVENERDFEYAFKINTLLKGNTIEIDVPLLEGNRFKAEFVHAGLANGPIYLYKNKVGGQVLLKIDAEKCEPNTVYEIDIDVGDIKVFGKNVEKIVIASKINRANNFPPHGFIGNARFEHDYN